MDDKFEVNCDPPEEGVATIYRNNLKCPHCDQVNNGLMSLAGSFRPNEGDASICFECIGVGIFKADGTLRIPNEIEQKELNQHPQIQSSLKRMRELRDKETN